MDIDWSTVWSHMVLLGCAYLLALPTALNSEQHDRAAGLRTFPLVAIATCGFMLIGIGALDGADPQSRVLQGIITGMGFIGGGAILKRGDSVSGTATATSLWSTGAIGAAVAWQRLEIAIVLSILTFVTMRFGRSVKPAINGKAGTDHGDDS